jgi:hypothetical protein
MAGVLRQLEMLARRQRREQDAAVAPEIDREVRTARCSPARRPIAQGGELCLSLLTFESVTGVSTDTGVKRQSSQHPSTISFSSCGSAVIGNAIAGIRKARQKKHGT